MMYERFLRDFSQGLAGLRGCSSQASFDASAKPKRLLKFLNCRPSQVSLSDLYRGWLLYTVHAVINAAVKNEWPPGPKKESLATQYFIWHVLNLAVSREHGSVPVCHLKNPVIIDFHPPKKWNHMYNAKSALS
jgi:hypothetical protein